MLEKLNFIHTSFSVTMTLKAEVFCLYSSQSTKEQTNTPKESRDFCISYALSLFDKYHELPIIILTQIWQEPELGSESKAASFPFFLI